jgi:hypothetical protein
VSAVNSAIGGIIVKTGKLWYKIAIEKRKRLKSWARAAQMGTHKVDVGLEISRA